MEQNAENKNAERLEETKKGLDLTLEILENRVLQTIEKFQQMQAENAQLKAELAAHKALAQRLDGLAEMLEDAAELPGANIPEACTVGPAGTFVVGLEAEAVEKDMGQPVEDEKPNHLPEVDWEATERNAALNAQDSQEQAGGGQQGTPGQPAGWQ